MPVDRYIIPVQVTGCIPNSNNKNQCKMSYFKPIVNAPLADARAGSGRASRRKADTRTPLPEKTHIGGYRIERLIGRGSFSLVYSASELECGRKVILKEYFPKHFAERDLDNNVLPGNQNKQLLFHEGLRQFHGEALTLRKIRHPNVLRTQNFFKTNHTAYLVAPNQYGRDLKWFMGTINKSLDAGLLYKVFLPALSALNYLHGSGLLHLDIKPANILLQPNGQPLLLDFGAAQSMNSSKRINKKQVLTHGFAPPEQYDRKRPLGPWTDIYALAASLYYCVSCRLPEKSRDSDRASRLDIDTYRSRYHPALLEAINSSLSIHETERFACIDDFAEAMLKGSPWDSLPEYEREVMRYDRNERVTLQSQEELARHAA